ncbi:Dehydration-responsive element-binding protein 1B [Morella rubra]|uniref:Dehydration-responsive element-binding protein 1B n=1 Tax=Morella rubra TaxID=262757 RepID=A0A6A1VVI4_9ROSI|nr:Dehydration-responsive element-binding protein 1B [Morella rubra]
MDFENESSSSSSDQLSPCSALEPISKSHKRKAGRKKFKETRHPVYRGVRQRNGEKWVCEVREPNKKSRIWVGTFLSPEMAARAYDVAALTLRGASALLNFPDSARLVPQARSASARDIRVAALQAAEAFRPTISVSSYSTSTSIALLSEKSQDKVLDPSLVDIMHSTESQKKVSEPLSLQIPREKSSEHVSEKRGTFFLDEESLWNMPGLLDSMAEGLILTPPAIYRGFDWDDVACDLDFTLWND